MWKYATSLSNCFGMKTLIKQRFPQISSSNTLHPSLEHKVPEASRRILEMLVKLSLALRLDNSGWMNTELGFCITSQNEMRMIRTTLLFWLLNSFGFNSSNINRNVRINESSVTVYLARCRGLYREEQLCRILLNVLGLIFQPRGFRFTFIILK